MQRRKPGQPHKGWKKAARKTKAVDPIEQAAKCVPTNWCDSLLTGPAGIGMPPYDCLTIQKLLQGIAARIRATPTLSQVREAD